MPTFLVNENSVCVLTVQIKWQIRTAFAVKHVRKRTTLSAPLHQIMTQKFAVKHS